MRQLGAPSVKAGTKALADAKKLSVGSETVNHPGSTAGAEPLLSIRLSLVGDNCHCNTTLVRGAQLCDQGRPFGVSDTVKRATPSGNGRGLVQPVYNRYPASVRALDQTGAAHAVKENVAPEWSTRFRSA